MFSGLATTGDAESVAWTSLVCPDHFSHDVDVDIDYICMSIFSALSS